MTTLLFALLIGVVAGLRTMTAPAAVTWAVHLGWLHVDGTWAAFLAHPITLWVFSLLALGEFVADQLPNTPSRRVPFQFGSRIVSGAFCGATIGSAFGNLVGGLIAGLVGAIVGTLAGAEARSRLASAFGNDHVAAILEDVIAVGGALWIVSSLA
ncbi:DUF4126 family protein [Lichenihabitans psoromatis]|uniref:DUF4126 family protein n=1 Tax=Lichenihabitans psoromatis TaxID=2528642 RepID=UPI003CCAEF6B